MSLQLLLLEDDSQLASYLHERLAGMGLQVSLALTCGQAAALCRSSCFDVYILDRLLPDGDSFDWLRQQRLAGDNTPAIFLTALGSVSDKVAGLGAADDYLVKPFEFDELHARLQALARRHVGTGDTVIHFGPLQIDRLAHCASIHQVPLRLKPKEFQLLDYLVQQQGALVTRKMLLQAVWGFTFDPETNIVETYISRLRAHLAEHPVSLKLETVRGSGYRLVNV